MDSQAALRALCANELTSKLVRSALLNLYELVMLKSLFGLNLIKEINITML